MENKIPKVIYYCWFGGNPLPPLAEKCIASWKKFLPDYEIKRWDESNFDVNIIPYTAQAYEEKKYAFVSDYARFWILYHYGGVYFDTDVEVIKPIDDIIEDGPFMGCENQSMTGEASQKLNVNPGLGLATIPKTPIFKELLDIYINLQFRKADGSLDTTTIVTYTSNFLSNKGLQNIPLTQTISGIKIYPKDFFCPMEYATGILDMTLNTRTIHHYSASWHGNREKIYLLVKRVLGKSFAQHCSKLEKKIKRIFSAKGK